MRVLISVDMEGIAGVVDPDDIRPGHAEYERCRRYMTDEASAAVRGVLAAHPDAAVVVCDAHAGFRNLLPDRLERRCTLLRGQPRRHSMITGIDEGVDALLLVGYHGRAGTAGSVLAHTVSGATIGAVRCNGVELGELGLNAALAAHHGVPTVLATGDDTLVREAADTVPGIATVEVKRAFGNRAAESLHPDEACARIEDAAQAALLSPPPPAPLIAGPVELEIDLLRPLMTELPYLIPGVERRGPLTVATTVDSIATAYDLLDVVTVLAGAS